MNNLQKVAAFWPKKEDFSALNLVVEVSGRGVGCYWYGKEPVQAEGLVIYYSAPEVTGDSMVEFLREFFKEPVFQKKHASVKIFIRPEESLLIPADYYSSTGAAASLDLVFGDVSGKVIFTEDLGSSGIKICYRMPSDLHAMITSKFNSDKLRHSASCYLQKTKETEGNFYDCIFSPNDFFVLVYFAGKLHMMQQFEYRSPADAAYFLLAISHHNGVKPETVRIRLGGTIDKDSNLYNEIFKYFLKLEWAGDRSGKVSGENEISMPPHYFDHLLSLASCG